VGAEQQQLDGPGSLDHTAAAAQSPARPQGRQEQQQQQPPLLGTQLPDLSDLSSRDTRCRVVLSLLTLLRELRGALGPWEQQQLLLLQLQAISAALLGQGGVDEAWGDTLMIYYGFLVDSVAHADADEAQHDLRNLLAEGSKGLVPAAQQQQQQGGGTAQQQQQQKKKKQKQQQQQQQQQGAGGLLRGFELQCIGDLDSPAHKVALHLSRELRRLFHTLAGGTAHTQQQQQQQQLDAVPPLLDPSEAKPRLQQLCKALMSSLQGAASGRDALKLHVLVAYGFLQAWVAQGDVGHVQQALAALLSAADTGL
jgi:hypothetical protein